MLLIHMSNGVKHPWLILTYLIVHMQISYEQVNDSTIDEPLNINGTFNNKPNIIKDILNTSSTNDISLINAYTNASTDLSLNTTDTGGYFEDESPTTTPVLYTTQKTLIADILNTTIGNIILHDSTQTAITPISKLSCDDRKLLETRFQPHYDKGLSKIKYCCPKGETYVTDERTGASSCQPTKISTDIKAINATFYNGCIVDNESDIKLEHEVGDACGPRDSATGSSGHLFLMYGKDMGDDLYVIQNGSLLQVDQLNDYFSIFHLYCLFKNDTTGSITALVCHSSENGLVHVSKAQSLIYAACMLISVPCLLVTVFIYLAIPELRNLHGKSLACHSVSMALGFLFLSVAQITGHLPQALGYTIQYFILSCFFWLAVMCLDICLHIWIYLPRFYEMKPSFYTIHFLAYAIISFGVPLILVSLTIGNQLPGHPSYYLKGLTDATHSSQQYFIPPICSILGICFILLVVSYFGFRKLSTTYARVFISRKDANESPKFHLRNIQQTAKSTTYLYIIMTINWIFEIISFYAQSTDASLALFDILNALQGVVIFIIFVSLPQPLRIIKRWWYDRGSLKLEDDTINNTELQLMQSEAK